MADKKGSVADEIKEMSSRAQKDKYLSDTKEDIRKVREGTLHSDFNDDTYFNAMLKKYKGDKADREEGLAVRDFNKTMVYANQMIKDGHQDYALKLLRGAYEVFNDAESMREIGEDKFNSYILSRTKRAVKSALKSHHSKKQIYEISKYALDLAEEVEDGMSERNSSSVLEKSVAPVVAIAGLGLGIAFMGSSITGNAIANFPTKTTSYIGVGLILIGIIAGLLWLTRKNKKVSKKKR